MTQVLDGRYELGDRIGRGGAGRVHRAVDRRLGREVAVKVLDDQAAAQADPVGRDRFLVEARTAAQLRHPHVVTVFDAGESDGELFLVMELVEGLTLGELIARRGPLAADEAATIATQILSALQAAHDRNIVHRDVKPANVIIDAQGDAHLTDFGIARRLDDIEEHLTSAGHVVGTPAYMAPEQALGGSLGVTTDVYLVGLVFDEMLTARRSRSAATSADVAARLAAGAAAVDPRDVVPDVGDEIARVVLRATDPDPSRRFATATEMSRAIEAAATVDVAPPPATATLVMPVAPGALAAPRRASRRRAAVLTVVAVSGVGLLAAASHDDLPVPPPGVVSASTVPSATVPPTTVPAPVATTPAAPATTAAPVEVPVDDGGGGGGGDGRGNGKGNGNGRGKD